MVPGFRSATVKWELIDDQNETVCTGGRPMDERKQVLQWADFCVVAMMVILAVMVIFY